MRKTSPQSTVHSPQQKNFLRLCGVLIFCAFAVTGCAKKEIKNIDSKGKNIICFGDSLTFGYGANPKEDYPTLLAKMLAAPVINAGIDGDTTSEALKRIEADVLAREPFLVIIEFGGNDFLREVPKEITINNVSVMVDKIQAKKAMVAIVDISAGMLLGEYGKAFNNLARQKGAIFIANVLDGILTNPRLKSDFIHPNREGYKIITQSIYRAIRPYLDQNNTLKKFGR